MKYLIIFVIVLSSCNIDDIPFDPDKNQDSYLTEFNSISANNYYEDDIFDDYKNIYSKWKVIGTDGGLFNQGYKIDFDYLLIKPYGIFGIVHNGQLVNHGKIIFSDQKEAGLLLVFQPELPNDSNMIQLLFDPEKYFLISNDSLMLYSPCCDRYNTILKKSN